MRAKQLSFLPKPEKLHGGEHTRGKRKTMRPIDPKRPLHVVMRSSRARGEWSMLRPRHAPHIENRVKRVGAKHGVRVYRYANVGNHIHLLVKTPNRRAFQSFLREVAGAIAMIVTGARKSQGTGGFWDGLAFSRIVEWGRDFRNVELYFIKNLFEAAGLLSRRMKAAGVKVIPLFGIGVPP